MVRKVTNPISNFTVGDTVRDFTNWISNFTNQSVKMLKNTEWISNFTNRYENPFNSVQVMTQNIAQDTRQ